jgi:hypothetical protein
VGVEIDGKSSDCAVDAVSKWSGGSYGGDKVRGRDHGFGNHEWTRRNIPEDLNLQVPSS